MRLNRKQTKMRELIQKLPLGKTKRKPSWIVQKAHLVPALVLLGFLVLVPICVQAQEQGFPMPAATGVLGRKDAGAFAEIRAHLLAVSATGWQSLEATGTLTYPDGISHEATLYLMGANNSRLDIQMEAGTRSFRQSGFAARFQHENGNHGSLPPATAGAGIVAFPRVWTDAATSSRISLYDHNTSAFNGQNLHRVTLEYPINISAASGAAKTAITDLYFDPNTHLLAYSVDAVTFNGPARQMFSRETSYEDYQQFSGIKVPTTIKQYLNGQLQWTLQLSQITVNAAPAANTFSF